MSRLGSHLKLIKSFMSVANESLIPETPCDANLQMNKNAFAAFTPYALLMLIVTSAFAADDMPYKPELERGLELQFEYLSIPQGQIQIMSSLSSRAESANMRNKQFPAPFLETLKMLETEGLVKLAELKQSQLDMVGNMGARIFTVVCTPKALDMSDKAKSDDNFIQIPFGSCKVKTVVKDVEYHQPSLPQSDDFRLIVGTCEMTYNDFGKKMLAKDQLVKFRAVLKVNPFNRTYHFETADLGGIDADDWPTNNIPQ